MKALTIAVVGARGRLGAYAVTHYGRTEGLSVVLQVQRGDDLRAALLASKPAVMLDVTEAGLGALHARVALECGVRPLIGTSGVSPAQASELDVYAREQRLGGLIVPNFSLGMVLLQRAAEDIVQHMGQCEIIELHHERKKDAPSGTATDTARRLAAKRGDASPIPIHSVRLPGHYAHQEVLFGAPGETLRLRHDMSSPEAFGPGLVAAARYCQTAVGVAVGLRHAL